MRKNSMPFQRKLPFHASRLLFSPASCMYTASNNLRGKGALYKSNRSSDIPGVASSDIPGVASVCSLIPGRVKACSNGPKADGLEPKSLNPGDTSKLRRHPPTFRRRSADTLLTYPAHGPLTYLCRADVRRHPTDTILPRSCLTLRRHFADVRPLYFSIDCYQWLYICLAYIALSQPTPVGCCEKAVQPRKVLRSNCLALPLHLRPISPSSLCLLKPPKLRAPPIIDALEFRKSLCYITRITRN